MTRTLFFSALLASPAAAQVYKCTDADGNPSYSQTPCPDRPSTEVNVGSTSGSDLNCSWARRFALDTARRMQAGQSSTDVFDLYGGIDSVSRGTVSLVNYVYQYEYADDIAAERVAALTQASCASGSLGDVSCEALPFSENDDPNRCEADSPEAFDAEQSEAAGQPVEDSDTGNVTTAREQATRDRQMTDPDAAQACKKPIREEMDEIFAAMREGYDPATGERYRERINELRLAYRECFR